MGTHRDEQREIDDKTIAAVRAGKNRLISIAKACGVQGLATLDAGHAETRKVDRSLQRLRKAGRLKYDAATGWTAAEDRKDER